MIKKIANVIKNNPILVKNNNHELLCQNAIDDKFVKSATDNTQNMIKTQITNLIEKSQLQDLIPDLINNNYWTNTVDFIATNLKKEVVIGLDNSETGAVERHVIAVDDFVNIITKIIANKIEKAPQNEQQYKKLYLELLKQVKKHQE